MADDEGGKRGREDAAGRDEERADEPGPARPPDTGDDDDAGDEEVGPAMPPKAKKKKVRTSPPPESPGSRALDAARFSRVASRA